MTGPANGLGALRALPAPAPDDPLIAAIRSLLPERSGEERALGYVRVNVGAGDTADSLRVPVLFHAANVAWQERFRTEGTRIFDELADDEAGGVMLRLLLGEVEMQLSLLEAYNPDMLGAEWVAAHCTEEQILDAFLGVVAAAFPTPVALARVLLANRQVAQWVRQMLIQTLYASSTASSPPSSGGGRKRSTKG